MKRNYMQSMIDRRHPATRGVCYEIGVKKKHTENKADYLSKFDGEHGICKSARTSAHAAESTASMVR